LVAILTLAQIDERLMLGLGAVSDPGVVGVGIFVADALPDSAAHTTLGELNPEIAVDSVDVHARFVKAVVAAA
jgi:hypothetical protein